MSVRRDAPAFIGPFPQRTEQLEDYPRPTQEECVHYVYETNDRDLAMVQQIYAPIAAELREKLSRSFFFSRQHFASEMHKRVEAADEARLNDFLDGQARVKAAEANLARVTKISADFDEAIWTIIYRKFRLSVQTQVFAAWKARYIKKRRKKHKKTYGANFYLRRLQRSFFLGWRGAISKQTKVALQERFEKKYADQREQKAVQWENKAAQLKNYFETMQVKLKTVISEREALARLYEASLNKGVGVLNRETETISRSPLITDINLQKYVTQLIQQQGMAFTQFTPKVQQPEAAAKPSQTMG